MPAFTYTAPGKSILFGEHAVVYGFPAIAVPLSTISMKITIYPQPLGKGIIIENLKTLETLYLENLENQNQYSYALTTIKNSLNIDHLPAMKIRIISSIPIASGLGSSAAFSVSISRAVAGFLGYNLTLQRINDIAFNIEKFQHGNPSGLDNTVIAYEKPIYFKRDAAPKILHIKTPINLIIADTGIRALTKDVVSMVKKDYENHPNKTMEILQKIGSISNSAKVKLEAGKHQDIGELMLENHSLLQQLGVSIPQLDKLVNIAVKEGAFGAKLCGGGKGGNIIAVVPPGIKKQVKHSLLKGGAVSCFYSKIEKENANEYNLP